jgi:hypothetical protein
MWHRPWRWAIALVAAVVLVGLANEAIVEFGGEQFFGLPTFARLAILLGMTCLLSAVVLPSGREAGDPLPPLPVSSLRRTSAAVQTESGRTMMTSRKPPERLDAKEREGSLSEVGGRLRPLRQQ